MMENYLQILQDSLERKLEILAAIETKSREQEEILKKADFTFKELDENMNAKSELIEKLTLLDDGFDSLYEKIKKELLENKDRYKAQIKALQNLIAEVTAKSASIEAIEIRNKAAIEAYFSREKKQLQDKKKVSNVAYNYYKTANKLNVIPPQFMDKKK